MAKIDRHSGDWKEVEAWLMERLKTSCKALEEHGLDVGDTEFHRGEIAVIRELLAEASPEAPIRTRKADYGLAVDKGK